MASRDVSINVGQLLNGCLNVYVIVVRFPRLVAINLLNVKTGNRRYHGIFFFFSARKFKLLIGWMDDEDTVKL